jgi:hypothetical protein
MATAFFSPSGSSKSAAAQHTSASSHGPFFMVFNLSSQSFISLLP